MNFDNSYRQLPERFYTSMLPEAVMKPELVKLNEPLAAFLGLPVDQLTAEVLAGNELLEGSDPIATVYAGHQFGNWNPQLGDGRAILLGEVIATDGERYDIQLKGSGRTPYSRGGDGRSPLGPVLREYIISEAMFALGVPTTRSLAAVTTGEQVRRQTVEPGAVLTRVAKSHIRVGTFEFFASKRDTEGLQLLLDHVIERHYPHLSDAESRPIAFLGAVAEAQAKLIAKWQLLGFIHGVMNTDNMLVSGETIDYGPCAFLNEYDPTTVYSSIDVYGRYAYGNQPGIGQWNIMALARALMPLIGTEQADVDEVQGVIESFEEHFAGYYSLGLAQKLGMSGLRTDDDIELVDQLQTLMEQAKADYTLTFRALANLVVGDTTELEDIFELPQSILEWADTWQRRLDQEDADQRDELKSRNPVLIPRNHRVNAALRAADAGGFKPFHTLVDLLADPYTLPDEHRDFAKPPEDFEKVQATFCGT